MKWIEILKTGTFTAKSGHKVTITDTDLTAIEASYNPEKRETPLVFGHPEDNQPAFGWVDTLKKSGNKLLARFKDVPDVVKQLVRDGYYKKVSVSLMPDKKTLRHVGLLGAVQPAVPGLKSVSFSDGDEPVTIELSVDVPDRNASETPGETQTQQTEDPMDEKELKQKLADEKAKNDKLIQERDAAQKEAEEAKTELSTSQDTARKETIETKVNALVGKKILAKDKPVVTQLALSLGGITDEIELSEGSGKKSLQDHLLDFLSGLPELALLDEFSASEKGSDDSTDLTGLTACL